MNNVLINDQLPTGNILQGYMKEHPHVAQVMSEHKDMPLQNPEDDFVSLKEFKTYMEELAYERLGLEIVL